MCPYHMYPDHMNLSSRHRCSDESYYMSGVMIYSEILEHFCNKTNSTKNSCNRLFPLLLSKAYPQPSTQDHHKANPEAYDESNKPFLFSALWKQLVSLWVVKHWNGKAVYSRVMTTWGHILYSLLPMVIYAAAGTTGPADSARSALGCAVSIGATTGSVFP